MNKGTLETTIIDKPHEDDIELIEAVKGIEWGLDYGSITLKIRDSKVTLVTIERTIKVDN